MLRKCGAKLHILFELTKIFRKKLHKLSAKGTCKPKIHVITNTDDTDKTDCGSTRVVGKLLQSKLQITPE